MNDCTNDSALKQKRIIVYLIYNFKFFYFFGKDAAYVMQKNVLQNVTCI